MTGKRRIAVLISGRGSNLQSLLDAAAEPDYPARIVLVLSNRANAAGLERARAAGVAAAIVDHKSFGKGDPGRLAFDRELTQRLEAANADLVCLAGFMRILTPEFVAHWEGRLVNIHPSLLPAFKGLDVHRRMIEAGVKIAGCTVHFVSAEMDSGPIIGQAATPVLPGDDPERLAARILELEHRLYPACLKALCHGKARLERTGVVSFDADLSNGATLINPV